MNEAKGDLWTYPADWRVITTNGRLNSVGEAIMGAGVALQAKKQFPELPYKLGKYIAMYGNRPFLLKQEGLITYPTKYDWRGLSSILLIRRSAELITVIVDKFNLRRIVMPRPGCLNGGLTWDFVRKHIVDMLDDRFTVVHP